MSDNPAETYGLEKPDGQRCPKCGAIIPVGVSTCAVCVKAEEPASQSEVAKEQSSLAKAYENAAHEASIGDPKHYEKLLTKSQFGIDWFSFLPLVVFGVVIIAIGYAAWKYIRFTSDYMSEAGQSVLVAGDAPGTKKCGRCGESVSSNLTAGEVCPKCGAIWVTDRTLIDPNDPVYRSPWGILWYVIPAGIVVGYIFMKLAS